MRWPSSSAGELPDVIFYPCGGGVGMDLACGRRLRKWSRWAGSVPSVPKIIVVQAEGCAPIVKAYERRQAEERLFRKCAHGGERAAGAESSRRFSGPQCGARRAAAVASDDEMIDVSCLVGER